MHSCSVQRYLSRKHCFYCNLYRYYEPETGRYLQPEPIYQNPEIVQAYAVAGYPLNPYAYAANNPLRLVDPDGLLFGDLIPAGENYGAEAAQWYADRSIRADNFWWETALYTAGGLLASLWTPDTSDATFWTIAGTCKGNNIYKFGKEYPRGNKIFRIAPFGNRKNDSIGKWPHYHRKVKLSNGDTKPGQALKRHRPWEKHETDTSLWDRF